MATQERYSLRLQWAEVELRLDNNSVSVEEVKAALQTLIEKVYRVGVVAHPTFEPRKNAAGPWTYWNPDINENNFSMDPVEGEVELRLHHFNEAIGDVEATRRLNEMGLIREDRLSVILAFLEANPDLQRQFPIITGAAWVRPGGDRGMVCAKGVAQGRLLSLYWGAHDWGAGCRFLVRRK